MLSISLMNNGNNECCTIEEYEELKFAVTFKEDIQNKYKKHKSHILLFDEDFIGKLDYLPQIVHSDYCCVDRIYFTLKNDIITKLMCDKNHIYCRCKICIEHGNNTYMGKIGNISITNIGKLLLKQNLD